MADVYKSINPVIAREFEQRIEESYVHIKPYLAQQDELYLMCRDCERWNGKEHDYTECRDRPCFIFWLAFKYLKWSLGYELCGG